jgi:hypothetical protein
MATANLQLVCDAIVNWCVESKLTLNAIKTVFMLFSRKALDFATLSLGLSIYDVNILLSIETQFLGFILDYRLKWTPHIAHKVLKAKKALFTLKKCLRATWGADAHRLRFLIAAAVDPIVLYGCSVWASFLNTKCGVRKLRAFQRSISISITKSFKSAPTDALLVIANIIPIDLRILQLSTLRFRSNSMLPFVDPSFRWLLKHIPYGSLQSKFEPSFRSSSLKEPPWSLTCVCHVISKEEDLPLCPIDAKTLRLYACHTRGAKAFSFCVLTINHAGTIEVHSGTLPAWASETQAALYAVNQALQRASSPNLLYHRAEIVSQFSAFSFAFPRAKLTGLQAINLELLTFINESSTVFACHDSRSSAGLMLAMAYCLLAAGPNVIPPTELAPLLPSKLCAKRETWEVILKLWNREWAQSDTGKITRLFFPNVSSARTLLRRPLSSQLTQILTGHCALKAHQYRFKFSDSPACECGYHEESVYHFLFHCPIFLRQRTFFRVACSTESVAWPPELAAIPKNPVVWQAMRAFIHSTGRLSSRGIKRVAASTS